MLKLLTVQQLLVDHFEGFSQRHRLSRDMWRAAVCMRDCRTARMGSHRIYCPQGHESRLAYNSCRHRVCPKCSAVSRELWLDGWRARLLNCPHFHVVFTTPHDLLPLWRYNRRRFADALFAAASGALKKLLGDAKYLGARPGLLAALHTWSQPLAAHVHLHVLVTAGGYSAGRWQVAKKNCLLPRKVLMIVFRGQLRAELLRALDRGELTVPPTTTEARLRGLLNRLGRTTWNVKILERYDHGVGVVTYLARYLKGGPISNRRLLKFERDGVRFRCRSRREAESPTTTTRLAMDDFFLRLLQHVPPHGLRVVRGYGLYAGGQRELLNEARQLLGQTALPSPPPDPPSWQAGERLGAVPGVWCCDSRLPFLLERATASRSCHPAYERAPSMLTGHNQKTIAFPVAPGLRAPHRRARRIPLPTEKPEPSESLSP